MFKIYVKKSAFGNGSEKKSDKKNFEKLKAEVIAILEKKDSEELKKAIEVFSKSEAHYTYLAKSDNGEWIEKAGYGVGTIRIWKGKKYKKISASPTRWVRVFDKEDRGAKSSMTRLINRVKNCKDENELYQFCMSNHALFQDENGVDLPIMDKLRAAIDIKKEKITGESENYGTYEGNGVTREKQNEFKTHDKITKEEADLHKVGRKLSQIPTSELKKEKDKYQRLVDNKTRNKVDHHNNFIFHDSYKQHLDAINAELEKRSAAKNTENKESEKYDDDAAFEEYKKLVTKENPTNEDHSRVGELVLEHFKHSDKSWPGGAKLRAENAAKKTTDSKVLSNGKTIKEVREKYGIKTDDNKAYKGKLATQKQIDEATKVAEKTELNREEMLKKPITRIQQYANSNVDDFDGGIDKFIEYKAEIQPEGVSMNEVGKEFARLINHNVARKIWADYENGALIINENGYFESKKDSDSKTYWIQDKGNNRITNEDAKNRIKSNLSQIDAYNSLIADSDKADSIKWNSKKDQLENENKNLMDKMNSEDRKEMESEAEKHQNRSNAMEGNKNAYKGKEEMKKMPLEELESYKDELYQKYIHIDVKNKKELGDARLAFREALDIWRDRISKSGEVQSEFKNRLMNKLMDMMHGSEPLYVEQWNLKEMSDGNLKRYIEGAEKWKDKGIVHLADPIIKKFEESKKEMFDNNDFVGPALDRDFYAISHSKVLENMKKELESRKNATPEKKAEIKEETKNDEPIKKQETSLNPFEPAESNNINEMKPIASNKKIGENEVIMPYSKELNAEIKSLNNCVSQDPNREFMQHVYYSKGNLVATDRRRLKTIKVGELEGIPDGSYVDVTSNKTGINIKKLDIDGLYPAYEKVIPDKLHQKVTLDNDTLKEKIKSMYADGAIEKKGTNLVQLEFKDGKVFIDDTPVGDALDIKLKSNFGDWMDRHKEDTNYVCFNAQNLINALSGKKSVLMMSDDADRPMAISTNSTTNVLMPMNGSNEKVDYSNKRKAKSDENDAKNKMRIANKKKLDDYLNSFNFDENQTDKVKNSIKNAGHQESDEGMIKRAYEALKDADKLLKSPPSKYMSESKYQTNKYGFMILAMANKDPEVRTLLEDAAKKYGVDVRKSIFDLIDFDSSEDEEDSDSDFNDYDASQPDLFNSTQYKVSEALDDIFCRC